MKSLDLFTLSPKEGSEPASTLAENALKNSVIKKEKY